MKKTYSKPDIFFEDFSLNTNIAAGCEKRPFNQGDGCGVLWGNIVIFTGTMNDCENNPVVEGSTKGNIVDKNNNGLCYHNPSQDFNVLYS